MTQELRGNLAQDIRAQLEDDINSGALMPGDFLDERKLAKRFGVSRTPVREAIHQLDAQGLVRTIPRQGVYVARMSIRELLAMFELQAELEGICARYCARRLTAAQRAELQDIHARMGASAQAGDIFGYAQGNSDLHELIYRGSHNRYLAEQARMIRRRTEIFRQNTFQREGRIGESHAEHESVIEAILAGRADDAYAAMRDHISVGGRGFAEFVMTLPDQMLESHEQAYPAARSASAGGHRPAARLGSAAKRPGTPIRVARSRP